MQESESSHTALPIDTRGSVLLIIPPRCSETLVKEVFPDDAALCDAKLYVCCERLFFIVFFELVQEFYSTPTVEAMRLWSPDVESTEMVINAIPLLSCILGDGVNGISVYTEQDPSDVYNFLTSLATQATSKMLEAEKEADEENALPSIGLSEEEILNLLPGIEQHSMEVCKVNAQAVQQLREMKENQVRELEELEASEEYRLLEDEPQEDIKRKQQAKQAAKTKMIRAYGIKYERQLEQLTNAQRACVRVYVELRHTVFQELQQCMEKKRKRQEEYDVSVSVDETATVQEEEEMSVYEQEIRGHQIRLQLIAALESLRPHSLTFQAIDQSLEKDKQKILEESTESKNASDLNSGFKREKFETKSVFIYEQITALDTSLQALSEEEGKELESIKNAANVKRTADPPIVEENILEEYEKDVQIVKEHYEKQKQFVLWQKRRLQLGLQVLKANPEVTLSVPSTS